MAGLVDQTHEGTEERWAPCTAVNAALPERGLPSWVLSKDVHFNRLTVNRPIRILTD